MIWPNLIDCTISGETLLTTEHVTAASQLHATATVIRNLVTTVSYRNEHFIATKRSALISTKWKSDAKDQDTSCNLIRCTIHRKRSTCQAGNLHCDERWLGSQSLRQNCSCQTGQQNVTPSLKPSFGFDRHNNECVQKDNQSRGMLSKAWRWPKLWLNLL